MRFADTSYFVALLNSRDHWHPLANAISQDDDLLVSTTWDMVELGNAMSAPPARHLFIQFLNRSLRARNLILIAADETWFTRGFDLYRRRPVKEWSLTDCISFLVMQDRGINEALTADHHFVQAGFQVLPQD